MPIYEDEKPWGLERVWATNPQYKAKFLTIDKNHRLSRKYHLSRDHTLYVLEGSLTVECGPNAEGDEITVVQLSEGETFNLYHNEVHRLCAGDSGVSLIEVSNGGSGDYIRVEDDYGRIDPLNLPGRIPKASSK